MPHHGRVTGGGALALRRTRDTFPIPGHEGRRSKPPPRPGCFADTRRTCSCGPCRPTRP